MRTVRTVNAMTRCTNKEHTMKVKQARTIVIEHKHVRINGESCISTEQVGANANPMVVPFAAARTARRVMIMRGQVDMQLRTYTR